VGHAVVWLAPQLTCCPQLFVTELHCCAPHDLLSESGTQPHALLTHAIPLEQVLQSICRLQLSVVMPQRFAHQCGSVPHMQSPLLGLHPQPVGQLSAQFHRIPHESTPGAQCVAQYVWSGVHESGVASLVPVSPAPASTPASDESTAASTSVGEGASS
jgi:hypothetical protein